MTTESLPVSPAESVAERTPKLLFPFLDLKQQFQGIRQETMAAVGRVMESQHFILGPEVEALELEVARELGLPPAIACASGSDALLLALMALEVGPGDEVITTPFTFVATAGAIARLQARPVFVDICPETYNLDPEQIERALSPRTRAIMPVHLFGLAAEMKPILELAEKRGLAVVEDAAQAIGARYEDRAVGGLGTIGCFSFFPSKNLGGAGDGGLMVTQDASLAERLRVLRAHGGRSKYQYERIGMNSRLDALQAAILGVKLRHLAAWSAGRRKNAERYRVLFEECGLNRRLRLPTVPDHCLHVYNQYVIAVEERDRLRKHLRAAGIPTEIYYPSPLHLQPAFEYLGYRAGDFPQSEAASRQVLALPIFAELSEEQQRDVVAAMADFYRINA